MELFEKFIKVLTDQGVTRGVAIAYLIISALLAVLIVVALVLRIIVVVKYFEGNHTQTKNGKTSFEVAEEALKKAGLDDVKIKKAGILRAFFIGNSYSVRKKTIYLRGSIAKKDSITAVSLAMQKVAIAKMDHTGNKMVRVRNTSQILSLVGPILFVPIVLVGMVVDYLLFDTLSMFSVIAIAVAFVIVIAGFVETLLNIPVERKANKMALEMITKDNLLDAEEIKVAKKVFDAYIVAYICEFIVAVVRMIQLILEVVIKSQINNKK